MAGAVSPGVVLAYTLIERNIRSIRALCKSSLMLFSVQTARRLGKHYLSLKVVRFSKVKFKKILSLSLVI